MLLLNKKTFPGGVNKELTSLVAASFPSEKGQKAPVAKGDVVAVTAEHKSGVPMLLASFHGDTDGLATIPALDALLTARTSEPDLAAHRIVFGLDANTYEFPKKGKQQSVLEFGAAFAVRKMGSCWDIGKGSGSIYGNYTTFNARTYLQPQLNKACKSSDLSTKKCGDVNPKDFILFDRAEFVPVDTSKDNTGEGRYVEGMAFPTLKFPSDHGIVSTMLKAAGKGGGKKKAR